MANKKGKNVARKHREAEKRRKRNKSNEEKSSSNLRSSAVNVVHARPAIPDEKVRFKAMGLLRPEEFDLFMSRVERYDINNHIEVRQNVVAGGMTNVILVSERSLEFLSDVTFVESLLQLHSALRIVSR